MTTEYSSSLPVRIGSGTQFVTTTEAGTRTLLDVNIVHNGGSLFSKPFNKIIVLTKTECGDPLTVKSQLNDIDVQLITATYDDENDLISLQVSDL